MPKYCLFDFDGVLTKVTYDGGDPKTFIDVMTVRKKYKIPFKKAMVRVLGNNPASIKEMIDNWYDNNTFNKRIVPIIKSVSEDFELCIATNNCPEIVNTFLDHYNLSDTFPNMNRFFPENLGLVWKPDKRYFMEICKYLNCQMKDLTLIDDTYENVKAIKQYGGTGLWYNVKQGRIF